MKLYLKIAFFLFSMSSFAIHKDRIFTNQYGNVKTCVITAFDNYSSTKNVEIFGQLAQQLSARLSFKDSIFVNFRHDSTHSFPKISIIEKGNDKNIKYIFLEIADFIKYQKKNLSKSNQNAIHINLLDRDFNIIENLKLLEYYILNKYNNTLKTIEYPAPFNDFEEKLKAQYYGMPNKMMESIVNTDNSKIILELLNKEIVFTKNSKVKGYYSNEMYHFKTENLSFDTKTLTFLVEINSGTFVFTTTDNYTYISSKSNEIKTKDLPSQNNKYPYLSSRLNLFDNYKNLGDKTVFISRPFSRQGFIFSEESEEIIKEYNDR